MTKKESRTLAEWVVATGKNRSIQLGDWLGWLFTAGSSAWMCVDDCGSGSGLRHSAVMSVSSVCQAEEGKRAGGIAAGMSQRGGEVGVAG